MKSKLLSISSSTLAAFFYLALIIGKTASATIYDTTNYNTQNGWTAATGVPTASRGYLITKVEGANGCNGRPIKFTCLGCEAKNTWLVVTTVLGVSSKVPPGTNNNVPYLTNNKPSPIVFESAPSGTTVPGVFSWTPNVTNGAFGAYSIALWRNSGSQPSPAVYPNLITVSSSCPQGSIVEKIYNESAP